MALKYRHIYCEALRGLVSQLSPGSQIKLHAALWLPCGNPKLLSQLPVECQNREWQRFPFQMQVTDQSLQLTIRKANKEKAYCTKKALCQIQAVTIETNHSTLSKSATLLFFYLVINSLSWHCWVFRSLNKCNLNWIKKLKLMTAFISQLPLFLQQPGIYQLSFWTAPGLVTQELHWLCLQGEHSRAALGSSQSDLGVTSHWPAVLTALSADEQGTCLNCSSTE